MGLGSRTASGEATIEPWTDLTHDLLTERVQLEFVKKELKTLIVCLYTVIVILTFYQTALS